MWMSSPDKLHQYQLTLSNKGPMLLKGAASSRYRLVKKIGQTESNQAHQRYQIYFDAIPVWGREIIIHQRHNTMRLTGSLILGIENDIPKTVSLLSESDAIAPIVAKVLSPIKAQRVEHVIYIDSKKNAHHAYLLSFYTSDDDRSIKNPHYMIDALDHRLLEKWDEATSSRAEGEGLGGNHITLPYRSGEFQYGTRSSRLPSLGTFPVERWALWCYLQTPEIALLDLGDFTIPSYQLDRIFPIAIEDEKNNALSSPNAFCMPGSRYHNENDNGHAPTNGSVSPNNDAMYFVNEILNLYREHGITKPLGKDLPLRVMTHIGDYNNAFYIGSIHYSDGSLYAHQQIVLGDGGGRFSALTQTIISHELSHGFTQNHSNLIYKGQSGAINESFSDMAAIAMKDSLQARYSFYWDRGDWSIGREIAFDGKPLRYVDHPAQDQVSIDNAKDYKAGIDVHYASGIFNRAFYVLATQPGWTIQSAFDVMIKANENYWVPNASFDSAACGVMQAAIDSGLDSSGVKVAFDDVGVTCTGKS